MVYTGDKKEVRYVMQVWFVTPVSGLICISTDHRRWTQQINMI